mmetsp:Transcript_104970/g.306647  ORF Transcript_104970/g.306647 Transcript_104970/m.306647 type:complete len:194 (+) Transcript_104970:68-649(+)
MGMLWLDGADEVLGRRKELDSLYTMIAACQNLAPTSGSGSALSGIVGAWRHVASFLLPPVPESVDRLRIPAHLNSAEMAAISSALSEWNSCLEARVQKERSLSEEWTPPGRGESDQTHCTLAELQVLRDQCKRTGFLLHQLELPHVHHTLNWAEAKGHGDKAAKRVLASKLYLADFHRDAVARSRGLSHLLAG